MFILIDHNPYPPDPLDFIPILHPPRMDGRPTLL